MKYLLSIILILTLASCEDLINVDLESGESQLVVDAIITTSSEDQYVRLSRSVDYYDYDLIEGVEGANVFMTDDASNTFTFSDMGNGEYKLDQSSEDFIPGTQFRLEVEVGNSKYYGTSGLRNVPEIDSITWVREKVDFPGIDADSIWVCEFWATDLEGLGDTYWIRGTYNGELATDNEINVGVVSYEASFGSGSTFDNKPFILPIRQTITGVTGDIEDLKAGDEIGVYLLSISRDFGSYLEVLQEQISNGGLFATPSANLPSNMKNYDENGDNTLGWFEVCNASVDSGIINYKTGSNR